MANAPELPEEFEHLWTYYLRLRSGNTPLTYSEIKNFSDLCHVDLEAWEVEVLIGVDREYWYGDSKSSN